MSSVYAVVGAKGGVGKTTTSVNLGAALATEGYSVATAELDLGMANLVDFLDVNVDVSEAVTLHDVLAGEADVEAACYPATEKFHLAISGTDLTGYADTDLSRLPDVVETLQWRYDIVLLDTPAGLSEETVRPLQLADEALLVSTPRVASIRNARNTLELAERVDTEARGLVLTKSGTGASPGADRIAEFLDVDLLGHVPEDDAIPHSQDRGESVIEYAPRSGAAVAYRKIARQLAESADEEASDGASTDPADESSPVVRGSTDAESSPDDDATPGQRVDSGNESDPSRERDGPKGRGATASDRRPDVSTRDRDETPERTRPSPTDRGEDPDRPDQPDRDDDADRSDRDDDADHTGQDDDADHTGRADHTDRADSVTDADTVTDDTSTPAPAPDGNRGPAESPRPASETESPDTDGAAGRPTAGVGTGAGADGDGPNSGGDVDETSTGRRTGGTDAAASTATDGGSGDGESGSDRVTEANRGTDEAEAETDDGSSLGERVRSLFGL